jgi:hypothetical protein
MVRRMKGKAKHAPGLIMSLFYVRKHCGEVFPNTIHAYL